MADAVGIDLCEVVRMEQNIKRYGDRFVKRILSERERALYCARHDKAAFLAGRFAGKEALIKSLGAYLKERPSLVDIEILKGEDGRPELITPQHINKKLPRGNFVVSISHEKHYAAAVVIFTEEK